MRRIILQVAALIVLALLFAIVQPQRERTRISEENQASGTWEDPERFEEHQRLCGEANAIEGLIQGELKLLLKQKTRREDDCIQILDGDFPDPPSP